MILPYLRFVMDQFRTHKVRFLLTISGIVVGVASLAVLASFITVGSDVLRQTNTRATGDDLMTISNDWRLRHKYPDERQVSRRDYHALDRSRTLDQVTFTPQYGPEEMTVVYESRDIEAMVMGVEPEAFPTNRLTLSAGREFLSDEYQNYGRVVIVGANLLEKFPKPWIGKSLRIKDYSLRIVGVLESKPTFGPGKRWSWNARVIIPATTYNTLFNPEKVPKSIVGKVNMLTNFATLEQALNGAQVMAEAVMMVEREHKNFQISGAEERDSNEATIMFVIKMLMIMTTVFSMIVGGINIMNIMLVTVTERTREIGIRRALGATRNAILLQFLTESVMITMTGAVIGLLLSLGGLKLLSVVLTKIYYPWPFFIAWWSVALGIGLTAAIGVVFGLSPARKAAKLDPVEALRYE